MSSVCINCHARLSCGCQRRTASNGAAVCTHCLAKYEAALKVKKNIPGSVTTLNTDPTNVQAFYKPSSMS